MVLFTAKRWGWSDPTITQKRRQRIARAACIQIAYDYGYQKELASSQLEKWEILLNKSIGNGVSSRTNPLSPLHSGAKTYTSEIEKAYPVEEFDPTLKHVLGTQVFL